MFLEYFFMQWNFVPWKNTYFPTVSFHLSFQNLDIFFNIFHLVIYLFIFFFWHRLAECCINQTRKDEGLVSKLYSNPPWIHAKKVVQSDLTYPSISLDNLVAKELELNNTLKPTLNLDFAVICLKCAEKLLAKSSTNSSTPDASSNPPSGTSSPAKNSNIQTR